MNVEILLALIFVIILFISRLHYSPCVMTFRCLKRNKTVLLVFALCCLWVSGHAAILADVKSKKNKNDSISWLKKIADKGQEANLKAKTEKYDFKKIFSDDIFDIDTLRKTSFEILDTGIPSKVGYGFLMGYTSGFCLKKISKILAFGIGATFLLFQGLSYQGYVSLNHDKLKNDIEDILDINSDGVLDSQDAVEAYTQLNRILQYNMPTGGGFTGGLLFGVRG